MTLSKRKSASKKQTITPDDSRQRILAASRVLFAKQGFSKTSTRTIAKEAGCNISLIVYHFGGKEGLLDAVAKDVAQKVETRLSEILHRNESHKDKFHNIVHFLNTYLHQNGEFIKIVFNAYLSENRPIPPQFAAQVQQNAQLLISFFESLQSAQIMNRALDPRITTTLLMGTAISQIIAEPLFSKVRGESSGKSRDIIEKNMASIFLKGIIQ